LPKGTRHDIEAAEEWIKCFPVGRRIGPDKLKKKFPALVKRYGFKELCDRTRAFTESHKGTERKFIPHPMTWINRGGLDEVEEMEEENKIQDPHEKLDLFCELINKHFEKSQRAKGNWSKIVEISDGKHIIDNWLKATNMMGWDRVKKIRKIMEDMKSGTIVTSFAHWEGRL